MASAIIPPGYSRVTFTFTLTGSTRIFQSSIDVQNLLLDGNPSGVMAAVRTQFIGGGAGPIAAANMLTGYTLVEMKILMRTLGGILLTAVDTTQIVGARVGSGMSINTSVLIKKVVTPAGRKYRGRLMWPPMYFTESDVNMTGNITASLATYQGGWTSIWTNLNPTTPAVLLHSDATTPTPLTALTVQAKIGTIGKRMRG